MLDTLYVDRLGDKIIKLETSQDTYYVPITHLKDADIRIRIETKGESRVSMYIRKDDALIKCNFRAKKESLRLIHSKLIKVLDELYTTIEE